MGSKSVASLNQVYTLEKQWLSHEQYLKLLQNVDESKCTNVPAVRPQPGELYIYRDDSKRLDWKCDQYQWKAWGQKAIPASKPTMICRYYNARSTNEFQRRAYVLYDQQESSPSTTLLHYVGSLEHVVQEPHGNRKLKERPHIRTAVSQLQIQKANIAHEPKKVYRQLSSVVQPPQCTPVLLPRDSKQVKNTIYQEKLRRMVSQDDVYALYVLSQTSTLYSKRLELAPNFFCTLYSDGMKKEFDRCKLMGKLTLYYDTTFNLGDFYVSPLVMKQEMFTECPSIPLAYQIHDSKVTRVHEEFFRFLSKQGWDLENRVIIVTDREAAIRKAMKEAIPNARTFLCWNHIQQDVKNWVLKHVNSEPDDVEVYVNHVWNLLDSNSDSELCCKVEQMSTQWSTKFVTYFHTYLLKDIKANAKWILLKNGVYTPGSGITINPSESFNALLKRLVNNQEVLLQSLVLSLYNLDLTYKRELLRGFCGQGDFSLKSDYETFRLGVNEAYAEMPSDKPINLIDMPQIWQDKFCLPKHDTAPHTPYSVDNLAKQILLGGQITLLPQHGVFIVSGTKETHVVKLFSRDGGMEESCTCKSKKSCHHVHAALLSIGIFKDTKTYKKIHTLQRRTRGYKAGRKQLPAKFSVVEAADDSKCIEDETDIGNTVLVPNLIPGTKTVKRRFSTLICHSQHSTDVSFSDAVTSTPAKKGRKVELTQRTLLGTVVPKKQALFPSQPSNNSELLLAHDGVYCKNSHAERIVIKDDLSVASIEAQDFNQKVAENRQFVVCGRLLYPSDLTPLDEHPRIVNHTEYYLSDSVLECYLAVLCWERNDSSNVLVASTESVLNYQQCDNAVTRALLTFVREDVPENDFIVIPIVRNAHCRLIVVVKKLKRIMYLDSKGCYDEDDVKFLLYIWKGYCLYHNLPFVDKDWSIWRPKDIPKQPNEYDCGAYVCLYAEVLITQSLTAFDKYHDFNKSVGTKKMFGYRQVIKAKLMKYMRQGTPSHTAHVVDTNKVATIDVGEINFDLIRFVEIPSETTSTAYLSTCIKNHWEETSLLCNVGSSCKQLKDCQVCCSSCSHWYHLFCIGLTKEKLPQKFICTNCLPKNNNLLSDSHRPRRIVKKMRLTDYEYDV